MKNTDDWQEDTYLNLRKLRTLGLLILVFGPVIVAEWLERRFHKNPVARVILTANGKLWAYCIGLSTHEANDGDLDGSIRSRDLDQTFHI